MKDSFTLIFDSLQKFLDSQKEIILKNQSVLAGFAFRSDEVLSAEMIDRLINSYERTFYYCSPNKSVQYVCLDESSAIIEAGDTRFAVTDKRVREMRSSFINNFHEYPEIKFPVFFGGMKFTPDSKGNEWDDFEDSAWFIPELLLVQKPDEFYFVFYLQISYGNSFRKLVNKLRLKLEMIEDCRSANETISFPVLISDEGTSPKDKKKWKNKVSEAIENILNDQFDKIVLSRKVELKLSGEVSNVKILKNFWLRYNDCCIFIYHHGQSTFFGATPELLAKFSEGIVSIDALAGSAKRGSSESEDDAISAKLLSDEKNLKEHNFVVESIKSSIVNFSSDIKIIKHLQIKKLENIQHIHSTIDANLKNPNTMLLLLKELYPTPAICGSPRDAALSYIKKNEHYKRGLYSGIIGWFNFEDEGEFLVAIRSGLYTGNKVYAYAGCGIVEDSDPEAEYNESVLKLKPVISLFTDENKN